MLASKHGVAARRQPSARGPRGIRAAATLAAALAAGAGALLPAGTSAASVGSDQTTINRLAAEIAANGAKVQSLVERSNLVAGQLQAIRKAIGHEQGALVSDRRAEVAAKARLRRIAVDAYVSAASGSAITFSTTASAATLPARQVYLGVATSSLGTAMTALTVDEHRTSVASTTLRTSESRDVATLHDLNAAQQATNTAIGSEQGLLGKVSANRLRLIEAANLRRQAAVEKQTEQQLAKKPPSQAVGAPPAPKPVVNAPASGGGSYANPLRSISGLSADRIDQGVDYGGFGPIYAIGDGVVLSTVNGGWPGGTYITYRLTDGPANGLVVYAAEDINPSVQVGETVTSSTVLGTLYGGPEGIETGWADGSLGDTMAAASGQFNGWNTTAFGENFSQLLASLGAPGGVTQSAPYGTLPAGWPGW